MPTSLLIRTSGYWPLPRFKRMWLGRWVPLSMVKAGAKSAIYHFKAPIHPSSLLVIEAPLKGALPRQLIVTINSKRRTLRRWIGGLYSDCNASSVSQVRLLYQTIAPLYRYHVEPTRAHQLAAFIPLFPPGSKVLDASAGDCTFAQAAAHAAKARAIPLTQVWCNDLSPAMLALAPRSLVPLAHRSISSAAHLPHPTSSFDGVLHSFSNLHAADRRALRSFHRVLRPNGLLVYHPVKAPGERWPKNFQEKTIAAFQKAGFSSIETKWMESLGKKKTRLQVYLARK